MSTIAMKQTKNTVSATFLPHKAYLSAHELAAAYNGTIGKTEKGFFKADFDSAKTAKQFKLDWETAYNANRKVEADTPAPASKPAQKPKASKGNKASSSKKTTKGKGKAKGNSFDFGKVKGKTNKEKNKALHAMLVGMGIADSRTPEYMSVWNARPWAK